PERGGGGERGSVAVERGHPVREPRKQRKAAGQREVEQGEEAAEAGQPAFLRGEPGLRHGPLLPQERGVRPPDAGAAAGGGRSPAYARGRRSARGADFLLRQS